MSEPTSALSFYDLILRVAKEAGIAYYGSGGDEVAMIPVDASDFDMCKQIVNDGIRMFIADAPPKGWRWMRRIMSVTLTATRVTGTADSGNDTRLTDAILIDTYDTINELVGWYIYILTGTGIGSWAVITAYNEGTGACTVADWLDKYGNAGGTNPDTGSTYAITPIETVGGDITRYPLAENFGGEVGGPIRYVADSLHGTRIEWCDESTIRARQAVNTLTGYPKLAAIRPLEYKSGGFGPKRRFELIVDKEPSTTEILEFPYTLFFDELRMVAGVGTAGTADNSVYDSALADQYPNEYFAGWIIRLIGGTGKNSYAPVTTTVSATGRFNVADWLFLDGADAGKDPAVGSAYYVEPVANLHPAGFRFDQAILAACLAQAEMEIEEIVAGYVEKYNKKDLLKAYAIDTRSAPRKLGLLRRYPGRQGARIDIDTTHVNDPSYWH